MNLQAVVNFKVIDESADWIVVDKPAPLIVHPANRRAEPTLLGGIEFLLAYEMENGARPAIINRLDRDTSGVVLVGKHPAAARALGMAFERREVEKEYLAVVLGWPEEEEWECAQPIIRAGELGPASIWVKQVVNPAGRHCHTKFCVERRFERPEGKFALLRCEPLTGRMHQIRVHLAASGHPVAGDKLYSGDGSEYLEWMDQGWTNRLRDRLWLPRHALHASKLAISWDGSRHEWHAELPDDLRGFLDGKPTCDTPDVVIWNRPA